MTTVPTIKSITSKKNLKDGEVKGISNVHIRMRGSTRDYAYQTIKNKILTLELKPGTKISEKTIAEKLKMSRTPVREAFMKLAEEELLDIYPQRGTFVSKIDLGFVEEGRFIRENIERAIVREACETFDQELLFQLETNITMQDLCLKKGSHHRLFELDEEFHRILFEGCDKMRSWRLVRQMNCDFDRLRMLRLASNHNWEVVVSQHKKILKCIQEKNATSAEEVMIEHLKLVIIEKEALEAQYSEYFR